MKTELSNNEKFVLEHFGLKEEDFEKLEPFVDWDALAKYIRKPTRVAVCHILDIAGKIVVNQGEPIRVHVEVPVENAQEELSKESLVFVEWWD